jgi:hypothetical protein
MVSLEVRFSHQGGRYLFEIDLLELRDLVRLHATVSYRYFAG